MRCGSGSRSSGTIETSELPGVIVIGDVVGVRDMVTAVAVETEHMEIQHGR